MKKLVLSFFAVLMFAFGWPTNVEASANPEPRRNYNCKMPRRHDMRPGDGHGINYSYNDEVRYLFSNLGLSYKQYDRMAKSYTKYRKDVDKISRKMCSADPRKIEKLRYEAIRSETAFLNDVKRSMSPGQFRMFESRFRSAVPCINVDSAPRPGQSGVGPVVKGPNPVLMTGEKRKC